MFKGTRPARVVLTTGAGGAAKRGTKTAPTPGRLLSTAGVPRQTAPAGTSQVVLTLESPANIGDSVAMIGMTANYLCTP